MSTKRLALRRLATTIGVIAIMALAFGSIRAASSWTATNAPLPVVPISVAALQADLADEYARSQDLTQQLQELDARSQELEGALAQANDRIGTDTTIATDLEQQLAAAAEKLDTLEQAIATAKASLAAQTAMADQAGAAGTGASSAGDYDDDEDEHDEHEDEDDEDEHEDDDDD